MKTKKEARTWLADQRYDMGKDILHYQTKLDDIYGAGAARDKVVFAGHMRQTYYDLLNKLESQSMRSLHDEIRASILGVFLEPEGPTPVFDAETMAKFKAYATFLQWVR